MIRFNAGHAAVLAGLTAVIISPSTVAQISTPNINAIALDEQTRGMCVLNGRPPALCACVTEAARRLISDVTERRVFYLYLFGEEAKGNQLRNSLKDQKGYDRRQAAADDAVTRCRGR